MAKDKISLLLISVLASFLVAEVILQSVWINPYAGSGVDKILKLRLHHKNLHQVLDRKQIDKKNPTVIYRTNQRGYIEPAFRFTNPDFTIAFLGGSTTECIAVDEEKRFPFLVSKLFEEEGKRVNSLNAARSGGTLHDSINVLLNHVILDEPDLVVMMHATNDIGVLKNDNDYSTRMGHDVAIADIGKYLLQMASSGSSFFGLLRKVMTVGQFQRNNDIDYKSSIINDLDPFKARLRVFVESSRAFGVVPILMTQPIAGSISNEITPQWVDQDAQAIFNRMIRETGKATNTEVIDLAAYISSRIKNGDKLNAIFYDGMHVSDYGSLMYARYITERIQQVIKIQ